MEQETRRIDKWEVRHAVRLGGIEIALGECEADVQQPYLVTNVNTNNPFGMEQYTESIVTDDYLEATEVFTDRLRAQIEKVRAARGQRSDVNMTPLDETCCIQGSRYEDYHGKVIVIAACKLFPEYRTPDHQLYFAEYGNGCSSTARGRAVYCVNLYTGERTRMERPDVLGVIKPDMLPTWANARLQRLQEQQKEKRARPPQERER